jgi:hypothetical protein
MCKSDIISQILYPFSNYCRRWFFKLCLIRFSYRRRRPWSIAIRDTKPCADKLAYMYSCMLRVTSRRTWTPRGALAPRVPPGCGGFVTREGDGHGPCLLLSSRPRSCSNATAHHVPAQFASDRSVAPTNVSGTHAYDVPCTAGRARNPASTLVVHSVYAPRAHAAAIPGSHGLNRDFLLTKLVYA